MKPKLPHIRHERGWLGAFTREQEPTALYPNGARIQKARSEPGDSTPLGTMGTVLGSVRDPDKAYCGYFVEWDNRKCVAVLVVEWKLSKELNP